MTLVITPTLGRSQFLEETVASVAALGPAVHHVLVCPTAEARALRSRIPGVEIFGSDARGVYAAIDAGRSACPECGAWTWLNDDDRLRPEAVGRALGRLAADPTIDVIYGRVDYCTTGGRSLGPLPVESCERRLRQAFAAGIPGMTQQGTFIRQVSAEVLGSFDPELRLAADFDFWAHAIARGLRFHFHDEIVADYRLHRGQLSADTDGVAREVATSARRRLGVIGPWRARLIRLAFQIRHAPGLARRFAASGCLRSSSLYRKASEGVLR